MDTSYWHKQDPNKPLFSDLIWSRPENKRHAGKLAIVGGNSFGFAAPGQAYGEANKAGIGVTRVLMPEAVKKAAGGLLPELEFSASNPSGSFAQASLSSWLDAADWADGVLLAGDLGHNSETTIVVEKFLNKYSGQVTLTQDAIGYGLQLPNIVDRQNTLLVMTMAELQKLAIVAHSELAFTHDMDLLRLVDALHDFTQTHACFIVVTHLDNIFVAVNGQVSTTSLLDNQKVSAASASVWWLQNKTKPFEAITSSQLQHN
ncbi:MAG: hypothetical protein ABI354_02810 [Candidatus Saccharimonadales bacterium]